MASDPTGPPGPTRPKTSHSSSGSKPPHVFSPAPSRPHTSWFQLLASPSPSPLSFATPAPVAVLESSYPQPHAALVQTTYQSTCCSPSAFIGNITQTANVPGSLINNDTIISNIATNESQPLMVNLADPWTRAHVRMCAHANDKCAACSISLICCSCRALRYTPGPPPVSPAPPIHRSRSASPILFRNVGNGSPPPDVGDNYPPYDDNAYTKALVECDTCNNSSCPRGPDRPATYTITVEQFDEGSEEMFNRTFRACSACNRSCKKSFLGHRIKSCMLDNSAREAFGKTNVKSGTFGHGTEP